MNVKSPELAINMQLAQTLPDTSSVNVSQDLTETVYMIVTRRLTFCIRTKVKSWQKRKVPSWLSGFNHLCNYLESVVMN